MYFSVTRFLSYFKICIALKPQLSPNLLSPWVKCPLKSASVSTCDRAVLCSGSVPTALIHRSTNDCTAATATHLYIVPEDLTVFVAQVKSVTSRFSRFFSGTEVRGTSVEYPSYSSLPLFVTFVSSPLRSTVQRSVVTLRDKRGRFVRGRGDSGTRSGPYPIPNYKILPYSLFKICTLFSCHDVFIRVLTLLLF